MLRAMPPCAWLRSEPMRKEWLVHVHDKMRPFAIGLEHRVVRALGCMPLLTNHRSYAYACMCARACVPETGGGQGTAHR